MTPLDGQVAVVTGAAEGIGAVIARALLALGADLAAADVKLVTLAAPPGQRVQAYECDVTNPAQVKDCCAAILAGAVLGVRGANWP